MFAAKRNYCTYQRRFMNRNCPKACQFCEKVRRLCSLHPENSSPFFHLPFFTSSSVGEPFSIFAI